MHTHFFSHFSASAHSTSTLHYFFPPLNHSIDTSRCYRTFNILSATGRSKRIPDDQSTSRMLLSREQVSTLLSRLPQRRYHIALPILLNTCGATSDPSTLMCLPKSRLNQTSHSTGPLPLSDAELHKQCNQSL